jgi:hypothetical protein
LLRSLEAWRHEQEVIRGILGLAKQTMRSPRKRRTIQDSRLSESRTLSCREELLDHFGELIAVNGAFLRTAPLLLATTTPFLAISANC